MPNLVPNYTKTTYIDQIKDGGGTIIQQGTKITANKMNNHESQIEAITNVLNSGGGLIPYDSKTATTPTSLGWYRIATSPLNIGNNTAIFKVTYVGTGVKGSAIFTASCKDGVTSATTIRFIDFTSTDITKGLTKVRIVYHTTPTGNYAYVDLYNPTVNSVTYKVDIIDSEGWSLISPDTVGVIPANYTTYEKNCGNVEDGLLPNSLLNAIKTVDGTGSGLDADLLDGRHSTDFLNIPNGRSVILENPNIDTILSNGQFYCFNPSNYPPQIESFNPKNGHLEVLSLDNNFVAQRYTPYALDNIVIQRVRAGGTWSTWKEIGGGNLFTIPRKFEVTGPIAGQTVFSYSGGAGEVVTTYFQGLGGQSYNGHHLLVIDGVELDYNAYPSSNYTLSEIRINFKNSIVIKMSPTSYNIIRIQGLVMTEK